MIENVGACCIRGFDYELTALGFIDSRSLIHIVNVGYRALVSDQPEALEVEPERFGKVSAIKDLRLAVFVVPRQIQTRLGAAYRGAVDWRGAFAGQKSEGSAGGQQLRGAASLPRIKLVRRSSIGLVAVDIRSGAPRQFSGVRQPDRFHRQPPNHRAW